jgi:hypothetical protein
VERWLTVVEGGTGGGFGGTASTAGPAGLWLTALVEER